MKSVSGKKLCKIVERHGWQLKRVTSSHHIYSKQGLSVILSIPVHGNRDLPVGTLRGIMKDAGLVEDDLKRP
jgi:predicted RNA binding protein YcfA (HicA-like mRNA interferase family)